MSCAKIKSFLTCPVFSACENQTGAGVGKNLPQSTDVDLRPASHGAPDVPQQPVDGGAHVADHDVGVLGGESRQTSFEPRSFNLEDSFRLARNHQHP